jgi:Sulfotransferase family
VTGYVLVFVLGSGRCGSTLLDLLLAGHPKILSLGEVAGVNAAFDPLDPPGEDLLVARFRQEYLDFWGALARRYEAETGAPFDRVALGTPRWRTLRSWSDEEMQSWARRNEAVLTAAHELSARPILVDSSKRFHRLHLLERSGRFRIRVIHLRRDGRAVANSYLRRYNSFVAGLRTWITSSAASVWLHRRFARDDWLVVRYEDLAARPEQSLERICGFLGLRYRPEMLRYRSHLYLGVAGNPLVKAAEGEAISPDERWREELGLGYRLLFAVVGGWVNRLQGYPALSRGRRSSNSS